MRSPWNRITQPIYSLSSKSKDGDNMNIISYATPITLKPKNFMCAIDTSTKTYENIENSMEGVLQVLSKEQAKAVNILGKRSGKEIDKLDKLKDDTMTFQGYKVLREALAFIYLDFYKEITVGDHNLFLGKVIKYSNNQEGENLNLQHLINKDIIL
jgi:flavin reductase (DIM6/NTAB) family NADH-FMN oxidoreductase RutF